MKLVHGDALAHIPNLPPVDLTVTSPPYNLDKPYRNATDSRSYQTYLDWIGEWLLELHRVTKDDGRLCLNVPLDTNKNGLRPLAAHYTRIAMAMGWLYHGTIIWNEGNISRRTAWGSWMSASAPYVIAPVEVILVLYKGTWKKTSGSQISTICKEDFIEWTNGLWTFSGARASQVGHPAPFPVELPRRCIELFSYKGDVVLDPFMGSGGTGVAAKQTNRDFIGIDISKDYVKLARRRIEKCGN